MLTQTSLVKDLKLYNYKVDISTTISTLIEQFRANPRLPGALIFEEELFLGAISQTSFWKYMSRPYSLELSAKRKIEHLLDFIKIKHLIVDRDEPIVEVAEKSLARPANLLEQPIIIKLSPLQYRLLDSHQLLIGYTEIYRVTNKQLQESQTLLEATNAKLEATMKRDEQTGLENRHSFKKYLLEAWQRLTGKKKWISLIRFDLDIFLEPQQDCYSQLALNGCLRKIGSEINSFLEPNKDLAIHYGEGRFAIVILDRNIIDTTRISEAIAQKIQLLEIFNRRTNQNENLSLNLGVASIKPDDLNSTEDLIMAVEQALERAKTIGKNAKIVKDVSGNKLKKERGLVTLNPQKTTGKLTRGSTYYPLNRALLN